ncbi:MAG: DinB family protein [Actinomycetota bacterium]
MDDFVLFCNRTLDGYERALTRVNDDSINTVAVSGGNTPAQWTCHAMGAAEWWTAHHVCGRPVERDRDAEFEARASVDEVLAHVARLRQLLEDLQPELAAATGVHFNPTTQTPLGTDWTVGACLIHAYEELAQHLGHLEITIDALEENFAR